MTDKEIQMEFQKVFERLSNIGVTLTKGAAKMNKAMLESLIEDSIDRLSAVGDSRCERSIEQLRVATRVLRDEGLSNTEQLKNSINSAASGLATIMNTRFDEMDNRLDDIDQHIDSNTDEIIDAIGADNPVVTAVVAILATIVGIVATIFGKSFFAKLTDVLYREDGSAVMKNGKIVEVAQFSPDECLLCGILTGIIAASVFLVVYFVVVRPFISARRARG